MSNKNYKRHLKQKKNAIQRSETVWAKKPVISDTAVRDEAAYFFATGKLFAEDQTEATAMELLEIREAELAPDDLVLNNEPVDHTPQTLEELEAKRNTPYIRIDRPLAGEEGLTASCSGDDWSFGPTTKLGELGTEAKKHQTETGHKLRGQ